MAELIEVSPPSVVTFVPKDKPLSIYGGGPQDAGGGRHPKHKSGEDELNAPASVNPPPLPLFVAYVELVPCM